MRGLAAAGAAGIARPSGLAAARGLVGLLPAALALALAGCAAPPPTDYQIELRQLAAEIAREEARTVAPGGEPAKAAAAHPHLLYRRAALTGSYVDYKATETALDRAVEASGPADELHLLRAMLDFKLHRLRRAGDAPAALNRLAGHPAAAALRADLALQQGRYEEARRGYQRLLAASPTWDNLARLAYLESKTGDVEGAERLYRRAEDEITAKEMRAYAWVRLQRGQLELDRGRYGEALAHFRRADRAYSGYWLIEEHLAEALDLVGHTADAVAIYRRLAAETRMPEITAALAAIVERTDPAAARVLRVEAERRFQAQYRLYPEAAAGHFLEYLIASPEASTDLVTIAEANHRARPNGESKALLARAYLRAGDAGKARALVEEILATPWRDGESVRLALETGLSPLPAR